MMSRFEWWRKFRGGTWYYNRYWTDLGRTCIFWWSRTELPRTGGNLCTLKDETYIK
jgi:hypothetical protein